MMLPKYGDLAGNYTVKVDHESSESEGNTP